MTLPYDMGNAGDLLKHGVLAEFVRWQCSLGIPLRFMDPFGGEPWGRLAPVVERRVRALEPSALHAAQSDIDRHRYYGSSLLVRRAAEAAGGRRISVLGSDACAQRRERLRACGVTMLDEALPEIGVSSERDRYDGYHAFEVIARNVMEGDLALIDPFVDDFVERRARVVVPQMAAMAERATVMLFVLNENPQSPTGRRFDALLADLIPGAWRVTCPPLKGTGVRGESRYHAEVVLAASLLRDPEREREVASLRRQLTDYLARLARVLDVSTERLELRIVGQ